MAPNPNGLAPDIFMGLNLHTNNFLGAESSFDIPTGAPELKTPEKLAEQVCSHLLDEIRFASNMVPTSAQGLLFLLMGVGKGISSVPIGRITEHSVGLLRLLKGFCGVTFEFTNHADDTSTVLARVIGAGLVNRNSELE